MRNLTEQHKLEREIAEEGLRRRSFMKDLGWGLLGFTLLFSSAGFMIIFIPNKMNPYSSILPFSCALLLDIVCIVTYFEDPKKKYAKDDNYKT